MAKSICHAIKVDKEGVTYHGKVSRPVMYNRKGMTSTNNVRGPEIVYE